ncbi:MAG: hypothetical protein H6728_16335 [Myxococcales bacterium]|nr:hypothetical protein [Myxococcales bacterium]MCB9644643.1 hypothetical protein [Myxococcales bacterium]
MNQNKRWISSSGAWEKKMFRLSWAFSAFVCLWAWFALPLAEANVPQQMTDAQQSSASSLPALGFGTSPHEGAWLPLSVYHALKKKAEEKPMPRSAQVIEATYKAQMKPGGLEVEGSLEIASQGDGWHLLPVLLGAYPLLSVNSVGGRPMMLPAGSADAWTSVWLFGSQRRVLKIRFFVPQQPGLDPLVVFRGVPAASSHFSVRFVGAGFRPTLEGGMANQTVRDGKIVEVSTMMHQPMEGIKLRWWQQETPHRVVKKDPRKSRMYARTYALLSIAKAGQEMFLTYRYTLVQAPRERFLLHVPKGLQIRTVRGLGLRDYRLRPAPKGDGQLLDVLLIEPVSERYELSLLAERRHAQDAPLKLPVPLGVQRETGFVGMEAVGNEEIKVQATGANAIDVQELPKEIIRGTTRPLLYAFRFTRRPASWDIEVKRHESVSLPASMIDRAEYVQVVNHEGISWVQAAYRVRNSFKQFMAMRLPKGAKIRSAFVDRLPVKPAMDAKKRALIPLKRSGQATSRAFLVDVVYSINLPKVQSYGRYRYALPQVDLWISSMSWRLYVPDGQITIAQSDLQLDQSRRTAQWFNVQSNTTPQTNQLLRFRGSRVSGNTADGSGQLPVRVSLPRVGQVYLFHRFHIPAMQKTTMAFSFVGHILQTLSGVLFFLAGFFWVFAIALWLMHFQAASRWALLIFAHGCVAFGFAAWTLSKLSWTLLLLGGLCGVLAAFVIRVLRWYDASRKVAA